MIYGSVCSGIESASIAWEPLGMRPAWFAEVEPFPSAILAHHWPNVGNLGDMTILPELVAAGAIEAPDILVGGTPCQAFSVAGLRKGLDDERGQLTLKFVELANETDKKRSGDECVVVWENVPGVLSSKDNAFGCFLGALVGEDCPLEPAGKKWSNAGCVYGPERTVAWRILDTQYFGVAQRRRVFVVASARKGFDPSAVLFESEGLRRDTPPSRETSSVVAALTARGVGTCGADDNQAQAGHIVHAQGSGSDSQLMATLCAQDNEKWGCNQWVNEGKAVICFDSRQDPNHYGNMAGPCSAATPPNAICYPIHDKTTRHAGKTGIGSGNGLGVGTEHDPAHTLTTGDKHAVFAFAENSRAEVRLEGGDGTRTGALSTGGGKPGQGIPTVAGSEVVRRLTPVECERLQGFPDNHTRIPWRNKSVEDCPDGPRYKAIGNSKAVPVIKFVGERIIKELSK